MGRSIHTLEGLCPPLSLIDERFMEVAVGKDLCFFNELFKVLLFLEADHLLIMEGYSPLLIKSGDLLIQPMPLLQIYQATQKRRASRIHVLRLLLDLPSPSKRKQEAARSASASPGKTLQSFFTQHFTGVHHLPQFVTPRVQEQIARLRDEAEERRPGYQFEVSHIGFSLLTEAVRKMNPVVSRQVGVTPSKSNLTVTRAKEYLVENLALPLTLDQIAWHVRLSREHLARLFRSTTGQTVFDYLSQLRLNAAKAHLCNPNLLVAEVARRSGFSSLPLFCRTFKRFMKMTPLEYRMERMEEVRFSPSEYSDTMSRKSVAASLVGTRR